MIKESSKTLILKLHIFSMLSVMLAGFLVLITLYVPFKDRLIANQKEYLTLSKNHLVKIIERSLSTVTSVANQVSSRTWAMQLTRDYLQGKISKKEATNSLQNILKGSLSSNANLLLIARNDLKNNNIIKVEKKHFSDEFLKKVYSHDNKSFRLMSFKNENYLIVKSKVKNAALEQIATDTLVFETTELIGYHLESKEGLAVYYLDGGKIHLLVAHNPSLLKELQANKAFQNFLKSTFKENIKRKFTTASVDGKDFIITHSVFQLVPWGVLSVTTQSALMRPLRNVIYLLIFLGIIIFLILPLSLNVILRPLSYKLLMKDSELNKFLQEQQQSLIEAKDELQASLDKIVEVISLTAEEHDPFTAGHQIRVAKLSEKIAQKMKLLPSLTHEIYLGALIHDVGKTKIPTEILTTPRKLTELQRKLIQTHPAAGLTIVKGVCFSPVITNIIFHHHERLDGSGYPGGLHAKDIPLSTRIVSVADVFEAMSSHRPYKAACSVAEALDELKKWAGIRYDAAIVACCVELFEKDGFELPEPAYKNIFINPNDFN